MNIVRVSILASLVVILGVIAQEKRDPVAEMKAVAEQFDRLKDKANGKVIEGKIKEVTSTEIKFVRKGETEILSLKPDKFAIEFWDGVRNAKQLLKVAEELRTKLDSRIEEATAENDKPDTVKQLREDLVKTRNYLSRIKNEDESREEYEKAVSVLKSQDYDTSELRSRIQKAIATRDSSLEKARAECAAFAASAKLKDFGKAHKEANEATNRLGEFVNNEENSIAKKAISEVHTSLIELCKSLAILATGKREGDLGQLDPVTLTEALRQMDDDRIALRKIIDQKILGRPIIGPFEAYLTHLNNQHLLGKSNVEASTALTALILKCKQACDAIEISPPAKFEDGEKTFEDYITELRNISNSYKTALDKMKTAPHRAYAFDQAEKFDVKFARDRREAIVKLDLVFMKRAIDEAKKDVSLETIRLRIRDFDVQRKRLLGYPTDQLPVALRERLTMGITSLVVALSESRVAEGVKVRDDLLQLQLRLRQRFAGLKEPSPSDTLKSLIQEGEKPTREFGVLEATLADGLKAAGGKHQKLEKLIAEVQQPSLEAKHTYTLLNMWGPTSVASSALTIPEVDGVDRVLAASDATLKSLPSDLPRELKELRESTESMLRSRELESYAVRHRILFAENDRSLAIRLADAEMHLRKQAVPDTRVALVEARELISAQHKLGEKYQPLLTGKYADQLEDRIESEKSLRARSDALLAEVRRAANWQALPIRGDPLVPPLQLHSRLRWDLLASQGRLDEAEGVLPSLSLSTDSTEPGLIARLYFARGLAAEKRGSLSEAAEWYRQAAEAAPGQPVAAAARSAGVRLETKMRSLQDEANAQQRVIALAAGTIILSVIVGIPAWRHSKPGRVARARKLLLRVGSSPDPMGSLQKAADLLVGFSDEHPVVRELRLRLSQISKVAILSDSGPAFPRVETAEADSKSVVRYTMTLPSTRESVHHCLNWLQTDGNVDAGITRGVISWLREQLSDCDGHSPDELRWRASASERCEQLFPKKQWPLLAQVRAFAALRDDESLVRAATRITHRGLKHEDSQAVLLHHGAALVRLERFREAVALLGSLQKQDRLPPEGERWLNIAKAAVRAKSPKPAASLDLIEKLVSDRSS